MNKVLRSSIIIVVVLPLIIFVAYKVASTSEANQSNVHNSLVVSVLPVKYIVNSIVGKDFEITVLVPPGSSPETYEPTPQQLMSMSDATFIFNIGLLDFEQELIKRLPVAIKNKVIDLSVGVNLLKGNCSGAQESHHHQGIDPHIWTSPKQLKIMAKTAYFAINRLYPDSMKYKKNYDLLMTQLDELDKQTAALIANSNIKHFFIYHPALTYYARDYGIEQVSIETEGKEPSAEQLKSLIKLAHAKNIGTVMYQREFSRSTVETIAGNIEAQAVMIDPLAEDIVSSIRHITELIVKRN